jgi:O-antigen/teichoic acid export membrane protein
MPSVYPLYILSLLIITSPLFEIYSILFKAKEKQKILAKFTFIALILNIFLNYILIKSFLLVSQEYAIFGAAIATLASRTFLLGFLIIKTKSQFKINLEKSHFIKPILATVVMVTFLIIFNNYVNLNFFLGIIEIFMAILIYFTSLKLLKGVNTSDFELIKQIFKK